MRSIRQVPVAVIGGAGFLGSHLTDYLVTQRECEVTVVDNLVIGRRDFVHPDARFVHHDITASEDYLYRLFFTRGIQYVFNYAARPYVPDSYDRPIMTLDVNTVGALKVINAAHQAGVKGILQVSSAEVYGSPQMDVNDKECGITEDHKLEPHSTYGAAKAAIDALVQVRWKEVKTPCIALRQFNCVGERDFFHPYVIPEIIQQLSRHNIRGRSEGQVMLGNNSRRDFLYAGDAVRMAVELLECGEFGEVYNLGSEESVGIYDLAHMIGKIMGFKQVTVLEDPTRKRKWEIWNLTSDNTKLYHTILSRPEVSLEQALERTVDDFNLHRPNPPR